MKMRHAETESKPRPFWRAGALLAALWLAGCGAAAGSASSPAAAPKSSAAAAASSARPAQSESAKPSSAAVSTSAPASGSSASAPAQGLTTIKLATIPGTQRFPLEVMEAQGFDKKYGLAIDEAKFPSPDAQYVALRGHSVDMGFGAATSIALFRTQGIDLVNVYSVVGFTNDVLVLKSSPLKSFADLKGKKLGLFGGAASTTTALFRAECVKYFGFDPIKDSQVTYGASPLLSGQVAKGDLDAVLAVDPDGAQLLLGGKFKSVGNIGDIWREKTHTDPVLVAINTSDQFANKNPQAVTNFIRAFRDSVNYINAHPETWKQLANELGITDPRGADLLRTRVGSKLFNKWDDQVVKGQKDFAQALIDVMGKDFMPSVPDAAYSTKFVPKD